MESDKFPVKPGDLLQISYEITTGEGEMIVLDLVGSTGKWLLGSSKRVVLPRGEQKGTIELRVPVGENEAFLVFYNNKISSTPTQFTINSLKIVNPSTPVNQLGVEVAPTLARGGAFISHEPEVPLSGDVMAPLRKASNLRTAATSVIVEEGKVMRITTDNSRQWKYQVESDKFPVKPGDLLQISY
ncbi:MAG: hypothetical protein JNJ47_08920, partial [Alphaproteobacteria bacterium]|nr:hypothetical protein [Alphaproteobacteria bacterium]